MTDITDGGLIEMALANERKQQRQMQALWLGMVDAVTALYYQLYAIIADKRLMVQRAPHWTRKPATEFGPDVTGYLELPTEIPDGRRNA